ncbi:MAG: hypothetical protein ACD_38C00165G0022 [uncultured bacterium]|nr:MAG: hypothetical protein ACD_38C00165G0022 [uncultured bacterium]
MLNVNLASCILGRFIVYFIYQLDRGWILMS